MTASTESEQRGRTAKNWVAAIVWTLLSVGAVVSCTAPYPDTWPKIIEEGDCTAINGEYSYSGRSSSGESSVSRRATAPIPELGRATHFSIEFVHPSRLKASAWEDSTLLESREFTDCQCVDGAVECPLGKYRSGVSGVFVQASGTLSASAKLYQASDRSLVVEVSSSGVSWCMGVIPLPDWEPGAYALFPRKSTVAVEKPSWASTCVITCPDGSRSSLVARVQGAVKPNENGCASLPAQALSEMCPGADTQNIVCGDCSTWERH